VSNIRLTGLFFIFYAIGVVLYAFGTIWPASTTMAQILLFVLVMLSFFDGIFLFMQKNPIQIQRNLATRMNLGDANSIELIVVNQSAYSLSLSVFEGYPSDMQARDRSIYCQLKPGTSHTETYEFIPRSRGIVKVGNVHILMNSLFGLVTRKLEINCAQTVSVYPSVLQMRKYQWMVFQQRKISSGLKRIRKVGQSREFEQIKPYVQGDDIRFMNWKATGRRNEPMLNQYQEDKSQSIYCIIDKSRSMKITEDRMTLLDYAINATLVMSNIAIRNGDKMGLFTLSHKMGTQLTADGSQIHLKRILEALYNQQTEFLEPNYELLVQQIKQHVRTRSLFILFTNFETEFAMRRVLPFLKLISQKHLIIVVLFDQQKLGDIVLKPLQSIEDVYRMGVTERLLSLKTRIARELNRNGIQTVITNPQHISVHTINKYLEIKARGLI
jgi:uncharacterized protein (DUF58 family)